MSIEYNLHCSDCGYGVWIASSYMAHDALFPTGDQGKRNLLAFLFAHTGHRLTFLRDDEQDLPEMDGDHITEWGDDGECRSTPVSEWAPRRGENSHADS